MAERASYEELEARIQELEESEKKLAFRNKQLSSLIDNSQMGIVILNKDMRVAECNEAFERIFQYSMQEMAGVRLDDLIAGPDEKQEALQSSASTLEGRQVQGTGLRRRKDGTFVEIKFNGVPVIVDGDVVGAYGVYEDITALRSAERAASEAEQAVRALLDAATDSAFLLDEADRILALNEIAARRIGRPAEELVGRYLLDLFPQKVAELRRANLKKARETGMPVRFFEKRDDMYFDSHYFPIADDQGKVTRIAIFARDVTAQHEAEKALRESEERYRTILEGIEEGYYETDLSGNFTFFNKPLSRIFGVPEDRLKGMNYRENTDEGFARRLYAVFHEVFRTNRPAKGAEYEVLLNNGTRLYVEVSASLLKDRKGSPVGFRGIIRDITERKLAEEERKRLEAQFHQAQRLEAIGTLAGGIAHDFNNLLMAMQGNASLMLLDKDQDQPDYGRLKNIEQCIQDAAALTKQLLGFARGGQYEVKPADLNELVRKCARMLSRTRKEIVIHEKYQEDLWTIAVDQGQIQQVLINLLINASQAMESGGDLFLETENVWLDEAQVREIRGVPGRYVKMRVTDTGIGMDKKTLGHIFEPFFTTKGMGRGSGLGLASAYGIVRNHGGMIKASSEAEKGSTFLVYLPVSDHEGSVAAGRLPDQDELMRGTETILVVDDEATVREVAEQMLSTLGYNVLAAGSGEEALEMVRQRVSGSDTGLALPDLIILDMIMPGTGGGETFDRLKAMAPDIKVLLSSGYSIDGQAREILGRGCSGFIQKPFNIRELSRKIREILDKIAIGACDGEGWRHEE